MLVFLLLLPAMSGCLGPDTRIEGTVEPEAAWQRVASVMYKGPHGELLIRADAPEPLLHRDGTWVMAKPIRVTGTLVAAGQEHTFWLDGAGRLVRWDDVCTGSESYCGVAITHREFRGSLAPVGIGWLPLLATGGPVIANVNDPGLRLSVQIVGPNQYQIAAEGLPRFGLIDFTGRYVYDGGPFPLKIEHLGASGWTTWVERQSVEWGHRHGAVPIAPLESWSLPQQETHAFAGGDQPAEHWVIAPRRFVQALRDDRSAGPTLVNGCILAGSVEPPGASINSTLLPPSETMTLVVQPEHGPGKTWYVTYDRHLGSDRFTVEQGDASVTRDCNLARRAVATWGVAFEKLDRLLPHGAALLDFNYQLSTREMKPDVAHSPSTYSLLYRSADGSAPRVPYRIEISATDGLPVWLYTAPGERDEIFAALAAS